MGAALLTVVSGAYLWVAVEYALSRRWGMCLAFTAYAIANIGFIWDLRQH